MTGQKESGEGTPVWQLAGMIAATVVISGLMVASPERISALGIAGLCGMWAAIGALLDRNRCRVIEVVR